MATSVDVLCSQDMLTYEEVVNICLASNQTKMKLLDDKLAALQSSSTYVVTCVNCNYVYS